MRKKRIYLSVFLTLFPIFAVLIAGLWYVSFLPAPWLAKIFHVLCLISTVIAVGFMIVLVAIVAAIIWRKPLGKLEIPIRWAIAVSFPSIVKMGKLISIDKESIGESFIEVNNFLVRNRHFNLDKERVMLLLPHCIQKATCKHKITLDIKNCKRCGQCKIGELAAFCEEEGISIVIATGGTAARKKIIDLRPKGVVAIACHRDLVSGIQDCYPLPVLGVLNERPEGPCYNTQVDLERVKKAVRFFLGEKQ